ncbi:MAG: murein biosynthesis integral membrane protein MurJ [bacterium]|nr:murein biosynthesis integral membrane protein MurJ [bacterium]
MIKKHSHAGTILTSAGIIGFFSLISRLVGLVRDRMLAGTFGAGDLLDSYYAAFKIPDFLNNLLVVGAVPAAFVPVVGGMIAKNRGGDANRVASGVLNLLTITMIVLSGVALIFAPALMQVVAPGFSEAQQVMTVQLTRIMLLSPIIFGIASVVSSYLNTTKRFVAYAIAPVMYNIGIIVGITFFVPWLGPIGLAWGVILGAVLNLLVQLPALWRAGFKYSFTVSLRDKGVLKVLRLAGPRVISIAAMQINLIVITAIATFYQSGTVSSYNLAFNMQSLPLGLIGLSLATVLFPYLAEAASHNDSERFISHLVGALRQLFFLIVPMSVILIILRVPLVRLVLGTGAFDFTDTFTTAAALGVFALSLFAQSAVPLLARAFYSMEDTRTPVMISIFSVVVNIVAALLLAPRLDIMGLAAAFSLAAIVDFVLHIIFLRSRLGSLRDTELVLSIGRVTIAAAAAGGVTLGIMLWLERVLSLTSVVEVGVVIAAAASGGVVIYGLVHWLLKGQEFKEVLATLRKKTG